MLSSFAQLRQQLHQSGPRSAVVAAAQDEHTPPGRAGRPAGRPDPPHPGGAPGPAPPPAGPSGRFGPGGGLGPRRNRGGVRRPGCGPGPPGAGQSAHQGPSVHGYPAGAVVDRAGGIRGDGLLSHVAILEVPAYHKLLYITDGGLVVAPGLEEKRAILRNALSLCRFLGYERPKAAALCAAETVSPPHARDRRRRRPPGGGERETSAPCLVEGPISLDLATSAEAARLKGYCSPVAGDADILLVPSIAAGNLLGKALYGLAGGKMAGVVLGASVPIALNSRGLPGRRNITPSSSAPPCLGGDSAKKRRFSCRNGCLS